MSWFDNSYPPLIFEQGQLGIFYVAIVISFLILVHSFYLHRWNWKIVRIVNDLAAFALIGESVCYICLGHVPNWTSREQLIISNILGDCIFSVVIQLADNFLTFTRYEAVVGGVARSHKYFAFLWVLFPMLMSWWLYWSLLPFIFDVNSAGCDFIHLMFGTYIASVSYLVYDVFYLGLLIRFLIDFSRKPTGFSGENYAYATLAVRAIGHTLMSIAGMLLACFNFPIGLPQESILIVVGIHFFLNWNNSRKLLQVREWLSTASSAVRASKCNLKIQIKPLPR